MIATEAVIFKPELSGKFLQCNLFPFPFNRNYVAAIRTLFAWSCPTAIARFIVTICIYSVKASAFRSLTHIREKFQERFLPSLAHRDPAPPVYPVLGITFRKASAFGMRPRSEFFGDSAGLCVSMNSRFSSSPIYLEASTTFAKSMPKVIGIDVFDDAAFTKTAPHGLSARICTTRENLKSGECDSGEVH